MFGYKIIKTSKLDELECNAEKGIWHSYNERELLDRVERYKQMALKAAEQRDEARRALADERQQRIQLADLVGRYDEICRKVREMQGKQGAQSREE